LSVVVALRQAFQLWNIITLGQYQSQLWNITSLGQYQSQLWNIITLGQYQYSTRVSASCPEWSRQTGSVFISLVVLASGLKSILAGLVLRPRLKGLGPVLGLEGSGLGQELKT